MTATAAAATKTAAAAGGGALVGAVIFPTDILLAGLVGGTMAILTISDLSTRQRLACMVSALVVSGMIGPIAAQILPRLLPDLLAGIEGEIRMPIGFLIGFVAYKSLLPALLNRARDEVEKRGAPDADRGGY